MESILTSVKQQLGIVEEYEHFDPQIIRDTNAVFMILRQMGVGPTDAFVIKDKNSTWTEFMPEADLEKIEAIKSYVGLRVRLLFDPPASSTVTETINRLITELEWRLYTAAETESI